MIKRNYLSKIEEKLDGIKEKPWKKDIDIDIDIEKEPNDVHTITKSKRSKKAFKVNSIK